MNRSPVLALILAFSTIHTSNNIIVSSLCELINERTYFLQRLEKLIDLLRHAHAA